MAALFFCATPLAAQVSPNVEWRSLQSMRFRVHYSPGLEELARTSLRYAEDAFTKLSRELKAPRGKIDIVVADNRDRSNGYASVFPSNRIVIYAMPPVDVPMLRGANDWLEGLITHELVHIFHMDRVQGLWRIPKFIFGRNPSLMPALYSPSWLREGLAVFYESKLTGGGRLGSGEFHMLVRGGAEVHALPGLGDLSGVTSRVPDGHTPYVFGAHIIHYLAERGGHEKMDAFVGSMSALLIPYLSSSSASRKLGISFGRAWREYSDSLERTYSPPTPPSSDWRVIAERTRTAWYPRWVNQDTLLYSRSDGRSAPGLYLVTPDGKSHRVARRNDVTVNAPAPGGAIVYSQPEFIDPYVIRSDLYRRDSDGRETRLTRGARLLSPDVRADGEIVAVQGGAGSSAIVRISSDGSRITQMAGPAPGEYWADPRWSPDGRQVAAVRRDSSGRNSLVVLDDVTRTVLVESRALVAGPGWLDANRILFQRDSGRSQIALAVRNGASVEVFDITSASTGVLQPDPSPAVAGGSRRIAAVEYRSDGYRLGTASLRVERAAAPSLATVPLYRPSESAGIAATAISTDTITARPYSAWRFMLPRYWVPIATVGGNDETVVGASTSAFDVVDRHSYGARILVNTADRVVEGDFGYSYAGLGNPVIGVSLAQTVDHDGLFSGAPATRVGFLREWSRSVAVSALVRRPRYRSSMSFSVGADFERITFDSDPAELLSQIVNFDPTARDYAAAAAGFAWGNTRRPALSISPEDGFTFSVSGRERWRLDGSTPPSASVTTSLRAFKSLNLPGFAHHVLAARASLGVAGRSTTSRFGVGGKSGSKLELFPGYSIGDVSRAFPVRGFEPSSLVGLRALTGSVEYRMPIAMPSQGVGMIPFFFDRISLSLFADAGAAWCPARYSTRPACNNIPTAPDENWIASAGAELNLDAALMYDAPYRLRVGAANIVRKPQDVVARQTEFYFTLGFPF